MRLLLSIGLALLADLIPLGHKPLVVELNDTYERIELTDSTSLEVFTGDSILVVFTACAPQCSSRARVYNKEWKPVRDILPPFPSVFPLATIDKETGRLIWTDNDTWEYTGN